MKPSVCALICSVEAAELPSRRIAPSAMGKSRKSTGRRCPSPATRRASYYGAKKRRRLPRPQLLARRPPPQLRQHRRVRRQSPRSLRQRNLLRNGRRQREVGCSVCSAQDCSAAAAGAAHCCCASAIGSRDRGETADRASDCTASGARRGRSDSRLNLGTASAPPAAAPVFVKPAVPGSPSSRFSGCSSGCSGQAGAGRCICFGGEGRERRVSACRATSCSCWS